MSATSPTPNSPPSNSSPPPLPPSSPPPSPPPVSQPNENPPESSNSTSNTPPPQLPPPPTQTTVPLPPPPQPVESPPPLPSPPPPLTNAPPPSVPVTSPPPESPLPPSPPLSSPPPPNPPQPPPLPPPSPPSTDPPLASPPPPLPSPSPPSSSSPPPLPTPPPESPPSPPDALPPPPPRRSSPQPRSPPRSVPPTSSPPPPPDTIAPENSPPPPPRRRTPPAPLASNPTPPPKDSPPESSSSPPPATLLSPPPSSPGSSPLPQIPTSRVPTPPASNKTSNNSDPGEAPGRANLNTNAGIGSGGVAAIVVVASVLLLCLFGLALWCVRSRRKKMSSLRGHIMPSPFGTSPNSDSTFLKVHSTVPLIGSRSGSDFTDSPRDPAAGGLGNSRPFFGFEELVQATNEFSAQNLLGEGGFGCVYKGYLPDGREIAVKQLKVGGGQGEREFKAEVEIISRIHHRHLVSLVGYCISDTRRLLVYDYVPNNNLYHHLHEGRTVLEWAVRVKIAAGSARGIAYLHEDCHPRIIHRDIKSSNILLNDNFDARVSDFGLAKLALETDTHITTRVMGTFGYVAPEYASSGKLTDKSDVYSFGVVMLELITGRKPVDASQPLGDESLVEWARPLLSHAIESGDYGNLVDPKLERNYVESEMLRMIEIAAACVRHSSAKRPRMSQVVRVFDSLGASDITNGMRVGESEVFNSAQQSEEIRWFRKMAFGSRDYSTDFYSQDINKTREENRENQSM